MADCKHNKLVKVIQKATGWVSILFGESHHYEYYMCVKCREEFIDL